MSKKVPSQTCENCSPFTMSSMPTKGQICRNQQNIRDSGHQRRAFRLGGGGIRSGWFRTTAGGHPAKGNLLFTEGKQGLKRWCCFLRMKMDGPSQSSLSAWLGNVGVPDAYEVQWDGGIWTRKRQPVDIEGASAEENRAASDAAAETVWRLDAPCHLTLWMELARRPSRCICRKSGGSVADQRQRQACQRNAA